MATIDDVLQHIRHLHGVELRQLAPTPDLGTMVASGSAFLPDYWWESVLPGCAILVVALGFNLLGDGLRDVLDAH